MDEGLTDAEIEDRLRAAPQERWDELEDAVAALQGEPGPGRWAGGQPVGTVVVDGVEHPLVHLPYVVYGPAVDRALAAVHGLLASSAFDWQAWSGLDRYRRGEGLEGAPVAEAVRLVMAMVRADRFSEGTIMACAEDGTLAAALDRLRRWHDEEGNRR